MKRGPLTHEEEEAIKDAFFNNKNNTVPEISKHTGISTHMVNGFLNKILKQYSITK